MKMRFWMAVILFFIFPLSIWAEDKPSTDNKEANPTDSESAEQDDKSLPAVFEGKVIWVIDGDSLCIDAGSVKIPGTKKPRAKKCQKRGVVEVRLAGIDAPEMDQIDGKAARKLVVKKVLNKKVTIQVEELDRYKRVIGWVVLPEEEDLSTYILESGYAYWYKKYYPDEVALASIQSPQKKEKPEFGKENFIRPFPVGFGGN